MSSINRSYDVVVVGGGTAGCAAATASARCGARTLLVERDGFLGGWSTAALVNPFMTHKASDGTPLVAGIYEEIRDRLAAESAIFGNCFDPEIMKQVLTEMVLDSGAQLLLHSVLTGAQAKNDGLALDLYTKAGFWRVDCKCGVDCTGDGDLAVDLGAKYESGDASGLQQAATVMFDMGGVDLVKAMDYVKDHPDQMRFPKLDPSMDAGDLAEDVISVAGYYELVSQARAAGEYDVPGDLIFYIGRPRKGEVTFNTTHIGRVDGTNPVDLTRAEVEGRRQMMHLVSFVRRYVPGFENAYLLRTPAHVGIRETRRVTGGYVFSGSDVAEARKFEDCVCRLAYPVDIHAGEGEGYTKEEDYSGPQAPPPGDWYEIPYRCLVPLDVDNVLTAGRCVSSTQAGHGAVRIIPSCAAMGQAAGTAAALAVAQGVSPASLDGKLVRERLREQGALV